jgi:hypothetical protein
LSITNTESCCSAESQEEEIEIRDEKPELRLFLTGDLLDVKILEDVRVLETKDAIGFVIPTDPDAGNEHEIFVALPPDTHWINERLFYIVLEHEWVHSEIIQLEGIPTTRMLDNFDTGSITSYPKPLLEKYTIE